MIYSGSGVVSFTNLSVPGEIMPLSMTSVSKGIGFCMIYSGSGVVSFTNLSVPGEIMPLFMKSVS